MGFEADQGEAAVVSAAVPCESEEGLGSTLRMWPGGPLRRWSFARSAGCSIPLAGGGYGGAYVCERCQSPSPGIYRVIQGVQSLASWICASCKSLRSATEQHQGAGGEGMGLPTLATYRIANRAGGRES